MAASGVAGGRSSEQIRSMEHLRKLSTKKTWG